MKSLMIFISALTYTTLSSAAMLSLNEAGKAGSSLRNETIQNLVIDQGSSASLTIYSETMSCKINNLNADEALSLQAELSAKSDAQIKIRCFGKAKQAERILGLETSKFHLGSSLAR